MLLIRQQNLYNSHLVVHCMIETPDGKVSLQCTDLSMLLGGRLRPGFAMIYKTLRFGSSGKHLWKDIVRIQTVASMRLQVLHDCFTTHSSMIHSCSPRLSVRSVGAPPLKLSCRGLDFILGGGAGDVHVSHCQSASPLHTTCFLAVVYNWADCLMRKFHQPGGAQPCVLYYTAHDGHAIATEQTTSLH